MAKFARMLVTAGIAAMAVAIYASVAVGHGGGSHEKKRGPQKAVLEQSLAPSVPTDPSFHGVAPGGLPWVLNRGTVRLKPNGRFDLRVRGLVIPVAPGNGTPGPVKTVTASLYCGADSDTAAADTTAAAPLSASGDARIRDKGFTVPPTCLAPVVLVHPNGDATHYIAVSGWRK